MNSKYYHWVRSVTLSLAAVIGAFCIIVFLLAMIFGIKPLNVVSGSMEPAIPTGSMVFSRTVSGSEIKKGDIVTVPRNIGEGTITHRVIKIEPQDTGLYNVYLKGDANDNADSDPYPIAEAQRYVFHVAVLGTIASLVQTQFGISIAVLLGAILLLFFIFPGGYKKVTTEGNESDVSTASSGNQAAFPVNTPPASPAVEKVKPFKRFSVAAKGLFATKPAEAKATVGSGAMVDAEGPKVLHPGQVGATIRANDAMQGLPSAGPISASPEPMMTATSTWVEPATVPDYSQTTAMATPNSYAESNAQPAAVNQLAPDWSTKNATPSMYGVGNQDVTAQQNDQQQFGRFDALPPSSMQAPLQINYPSSLSAVDVAAPPANTQFSASEAAFGDVPPKVTDPATFAAKALAAAQALQQAQAHVKAIAEAQSAAEAQARVEAEAAAQAKAAAEAIAQARAVAQARAAAEEHLRQEAIARMEAEAREHAAAEQRRQQQEMLARAEAEAQERARIAAAEQARLASEAQAAAERQAAQYRAAEHAARVAAEAQATAEAQAEAARFAVAQAESAQFAANAAAQAAASQQFAQGSPLYSPPAPQFSPSAPQYDYAPAAPAFPLVNFPSQPVTDPFAELRPVATSGHVAPEPANYPTAPESFGHSPNAQYLQPVPTPPSAFHPASVSEVNPVSPVSQPTPVYQPTVLPDSDSPRPIAPSTVSVPFVQAGTGVPTPESVTVPKPEADVYPEPAKASSHAGAQYGQNLPFSSIHTQTDSISIGETSVSAVQRSGRHGRLR